MKLMFCWLVFLFLSGCGAAPDKLAQETAPPHATSQSLVDEATAPDTEDGFIGVESGQLEKIEMAACDKIAALMAHSDAAMATLQSTLKTVNFDLRKLSCISNPDGKTAWGLIPKNIRFEHVDVSRWSDCTDQSMLCPDTSVGCATADFQIVFVDDAGEIHRGQTVHLSVSRFCRIFAGIQYHFDYDGDGIFEVAVENTRQESRGVNVMRTQILTFEGGQIQPYAPAKEYDVSRLADLDGDGRPDLVLFNRIELNVARCTPDATVPMPVGPEFVAHSLTDGSFSAMDAVAIRPWYEFCPDPPGATAIIPPRKRGKFDQMQFKKNLACSLVWGDVASARDALDECHSDQKTLLRCVTSESMPKAARVRYKTPSVCADRDALLKWIETPPPPILKPRSISLCGVLSGSGYPKLSLLVPLGENATEVQRFEVVGTGGLIPPIETEVGWWVCVTEGHIISYPEAGMADAYGKIVVTHLLSDKTNGEKGME